MIEVICPECGDKLDPNIFLGKQICSECGCDLSANTKLYNRVKRKMDETALSRQSEPPAPEFPKSESITNIRETAHNEVSPQKTMYRKNMSMSTTGRIETVETTSSSYKPDDKTEKDTSSSFSMTANEKTTQNETDELVYEKETHQIDSHQNQPTNPKAENLQIEYEEMQPTDTASSCRTDNDSDSDFHEAEDVLSLSSRQKEKRISNLIESAPDAYERSFLPKKEKKFFSSVKKVVKDNISFPKEKEKLSSYSSQKSKRKEPSGKKRLSLECKCNYSSNEDGYYNDIFFDNEPGADPIPFFTTLKVIASMIGLFLLESFFIYYV